MHVQLVYWLCHNTTNPLKYEYESFVSYHNTNGASVNTVSFEMNQNGWNDAIGHFSR